ncbi:MAG: NADPH-dependent 7-cyano-7-deazaguanine reductase QueF [Vicinamibacteria bacterium]|nr:NADPH-dependent 7-cyano-7-deazaguanine reductase QueF [Vicinamibacteria bacterium]
MERRSISVLETFPNPSPEREYTIEINCPEFTSLCPKTGQPDFATIVISYAPARRCLELKSLKLYLFEYRDQGVYYEKVTNQILDDLVVVVKPRRMQVEGRFSVRGGIATVVRAVYEARRRRP